jgi:hypothetical protein
MDKYRDNFAGRMAPKMDYSSGIGQAKIEPFKESQMALVKSMFAKEEREQFFSDVYGEILTDLFVAWLRTEPHATKERDFLYASAMALGSVKAKMVGIEMYGANMAFIQNQNKPKSQEGEMNE